MLFPLRRYAYLTLALLFLQTVLPTVSWGQTLPLPSGPFPDAPNIPAPPLPAPPTEDGALPPPEGTPAPAPLVVPVLDGVTELQRLLRGLSGSRGLQSDMMSDPEDWSTMGMTSEPVHVEVGPVSSLLAGSALVSLTAPLTGVQMGTAIGRGTMTGIVGSVSPVRQTDTLTGYEALGPYYLTRTPVVAGSEQVTRQGAVLRRDVDYRLDAATGVLTFLREPAPMTAESIQVRYEVAMNGLAGGTVYAARGALPVGGGLTLGLTHLGLAAEADAARRAVQGLDLDWQPGHGLGMQMAYAVSPGAPRALPVERIVDESLPIAADSPLLRQVFHVRKAPAVEGSEEVRAGARLLSPRTDYVFDARTGELRLRTGILPALTTMLLVSYTPQPASSGDGDAAMTASLNYAAGRATASAAYRAVDGGFAPLDGTPMPAGATLDWNGSFALTSDVSVTANGGTGSTPLEGGLTSAQQRQAFGIDVHTPQLPALSLQRSTATTAMGPTSERTTTDTAALSWMRGSLSAVLNWDHARVLSRHATVGLGEALPTPDTSATQNTVLTLGYQPAPTLNVGVTLTGNTGDSTMGGARQENRGSGVATQVTYAPTARLTANAGWQSSATTMGGVSGEGTQALRQTTAGVTWLAPGGLSLGASVATDTQRFGNAAPDGSAAITALANTTTTLTAGYQRGERVNTSITVTDTAGHGGPLRAQSLVASASARPSDRLLLTGNAWASRSRADMMDGASTSAINSSLAADYHLAGPWHAEARTMRDSVATGTDTASQHATHSVALAWKPREGVAVRVMSGVGDGADAGVGGQRAALVGLTADIAKPGASLGASVRRVTGSGDGPGQLWQSTASGTDMTLAPSLALPADAGAATALSLRGSVQSGRHELAAQSEWLAAGSSRVVYDVTWRYHTQRTTSLALVARRLEGGGDQISFDGTIRF